MTDHRFVFAYDWVDHKVMRSTVIARHIPPVTCTKSVFASVLRLAVTRNDTLSLSSPQAQWKLSATTIVFVHVEQSFIENYPLLNMWSVKKRTVKSGTNKSVLNGHCFGRIHAHHWNCFHIWTVERHSSKLQRCNKLLQSPTIELALVIGLLKSLNESREKLVIMSGVQLIAFAIAQTNAKLAECPTRSPLAI